jgi:hypothetical protein
LTNESGEKYLSLYVDELTEHVLVENLAKIKAAFSQLPTNFYTILMNRLKDKGFTDQQLIDSVNNVIDTCVYPVPTIANFINFEKKVRLFTYNEMTKKVHDSGGDSSIWDMHDKRNIDGIVYWFLKY